jgi:hypothetical protein
MVALQGCIGVSGGKGTNPATPPVAGEKVPAELHKGMKPEEVRQALGNPVRVQPLKVPEGKAERWIYTRGKKTETRRVATGTMDLPYVDPITGQTRMIPEPVYSDEATTITEELHLFWHNGELVDWKIEYRSDRSYTQI